MAGFMGGTLGFASTVGAAIGGAARQGNELFAEQRAQERQNEIMNDQVWMNKFDQAQQQERENTKTRQNESNLLQTFTASLGGDRSLGFHALNLWRSTKNPDTAAILQSVKSNNPNPNPASTSPFEQQQETDAGAGRARLESLYGRLNPANQQRVGPLSQYQQPQANQGQPQQQPDSMSSQPIQQSNIGSGFNIGQTKMTPAQLDILNHASTFLDRDSLERTLIAANLPAAQAKTVAQGMVTAKEHAENKINEAHASRATPDELAKIDENKLNLKDSESYLHDPKTGLQARYQDVGTLASQRVDITQMYNALNRGLLAGKTQPMFDEINRVVKPLLGIDLASMGVSNTISDTTEMKKAISNAIIERLKTLHFGRITNKEAQYVEDGLLSTGSDPNTNMKIVLGIQASLKSAQDMVTKEYDTVYGDRTKPLSERVQLGREAKLNIMNEYLKSNEGGTPWPQVRTASEVQGMKPGVWFEFNDGGMHIKMPDGTIKNAGDKLN